MTANRIFIYGCYGYTGTLIVKEAMKRKLGIVLGGRNAPKCKSLAELVGIDPKNTIIFSLDDEEHVQKCFQKLPNDIVAVMNVAGPYCETFDVIVRACIKNHLHYIDVTGEVEVFEKCIKINDAAREARITLVPGCGFDVVPTDCIANYLHKKLPEATHLELGFLAGESTVSHGTMKTITTNFGKCMLERKDNKLQENPYDFIKIPFKNHEDVRVPHNQLLNSSLISSGDITTSWWSTKIPNIRAYMASERVGDDWMFYFLSFKFARFMMGIMPSFLKNKIIPEQGPSVYELENTNSQVWGRVSNSNQTQKKVEARLKLCSAYKFTALVAVEVMDRFIKGEMNSEKYYGFQTPAMLFGEKFVNEIDSKFVFEDIKQEN